MTHRYLVADLFCGAGGSSTGAQRALRALGAEMDLVAVNHWDRAIETHTRNHPNARHHNIDLDAARPEALVPEGRLDLLMASPECTHHSRARGGKPVNDQRRMSAWHVQRWASALDVRCILVENVPEFMEWGPVLASGRPDPHQKGAYFQAWVQALWAMGYDTDWRLLNAADYGDATTRVRFFLQARKDGVSIRWPEPTHSRTGAADLFGQRPRWRAAREVIDWSDTGHSLLTRARPLSLKTRLRIARGLQRFGGALAGHYIRLLALPAEDEAAFLTDIRAAEAAAPFVFANRNMNAPKAVTSPIPCLTTTTGGGICLVDAQAEPFVCAQRNHTLPRGLDEPLPTLTASQGSGCMSLVTPQAQSFILGQQSDSAPRPADVPLPTVAAAGAISLTTPTLIPYYSTGVADSVEQPLATITTKSRFGLCCPLAVPYGPKAEARSVDAPLPTILTRDRLGMATPTVEPFLVPQFGEAPGQPPRVHDLSAPLPAVTSHGAGALVAPTLVTVNHAGGDGRAQSVETPLPTLTSKRSTALIAPVALPDAAGQTDGAVVLIGGVPHRLDIRFRMLKNRELARAMGFDDAEAEYEFAGNVGEVTRQIGNAVAVGTAAALVNAIFGQLPILSTPDKMDVHTGAQRR